MKRRIGYIVFILLLLMLLSACSSEEVSQVNVLDHVEVEYEGLDSDGTASFEVDRRAVLMGLFGVEDSDTYEEKLLKLYNKDEETYDVIQDLGSMYEVTIDKDEGLSNGDIVTLSVSVEAPAANLIESTEKEFTVEGLEEPEIITSEEVKKHVVPYFIGANGKGFVQIENTFKNELKQIDFTVENDGQLSNGDKVELIINEESDSITPIDYGYKFEDNFKVEVEVEDLVAFAEKAEDIKNLKDIKQMIDERANEVFKDDVLNKYKFEQELLLYRQFDDEIEPHTSLFGGGMKIDVETNGSIVALYSVKQYDAYDDKLESEYIATVGYENLAIDEDGSVNVADMVDISSKYEREESKSLKTLQQIYEGNGYEVVK